MGGFPQGPRDGCTHEMPAASSKPIPLRVITAPEPPPLPEGAIELLQEYGRLDETDRGRLLAFARVMRATR